MTNKRKIVNFIIALFPILLVGIFAIAKFDYYYDLNDDVLIKDIISGAYSGVPESRNFQNLWLFSWIVSLLYKLTSRIGWYGIILILSQYLSVLLMIYRGLGLLDRTKGLKDFIDSIYGLLGKLLFSIAFTLIISVLMMYHLVNIQYTVTVAFISGAAAMWFSSLEEEELAYRFVLKALPGILLIAFGFLIRSEMMLLMLPFVALSAVIRWSYEKNLFSLACIKKYVYSFLIVLLLMAVGLLTDKLAYKSAEWKEFISLFDARTELYDYQVVPPYDGNEAFYESIGLGREEAGLFDNYNFGIDSKIDSEIMWDVARYAGSLRQEDKSFTERFKEKFRIYIYEISHGRNSTGSDYPYNIVTIFLYLLVLAMIFGSRRFIELLRPATLFLGRTAIWMYILLGDRSPDRITHSLYLIEIAVLLGMILLNLLYSKAGAATVITELIVLSIVPLILGIAMFGETYKWVLANQEIRKVENSDYLKLYEYMEQNGDAFYLMDVYSSVSYSERVFGQQANINKFNSETLGGWACNSPSEREKLLKFGDNMESMLLKDSVFFVRNTERSMDWLSRYYAEKDIDISISLVDKIGEFEIYDIRG